MGGAAEERRNRRKDANAPPTGASPDDAADAERTHWRGYDGTGRDEAETMEDAEEQANEEDKEDPRLGYD